MSDISENLSLPCGWDTKYDFKTGKRYYINHITKHTSFEDPRMKYKKIQAADSSIQLASYQSSPIRSYSPQPFHHMHQDINFSSGRPSPIIGRSYSPLMGSNAIHYLAQKPHDYPTVETSVSKIKALFPTAPESHIKALLVKYHYREAVVMSALQVEKHPLTTPGPFSSPLQTAKHMLSQITPSVAGSPGRFSLTSAFRNLSPRRSPRASPKIKIKYLKSMFPIVDETIIVETLSNSENNVHKASESLKVMGYYKKGTSPLKYYLQNKQDCHSNEKDSIIEDKIHIPLHDPPPQSIQKSVEEKRMIKKNLEEKFSNIAEPIINLALDTACYDENRAEQFLKTSMENAKNENLVQSVDEKVCNSNVRGVENLLTNQVINGMDCMEKRLADSGIWDKNSTDNAESKSDASSLNFSSYESIGTTKGSQNRLESSIESPVKITKLSDVLEVKEETEHSIKEVQKDSKDKSSTFLSKTGIKLCAKFIPKGPNKELLRNSNNCVAKGPNSSLVKGPQKGLAKGSLVISNRKTTATTAKKDVSEKSQTCLIS